MDIKQNPPISDLQIAIEKMVRLVSEKGKRILLTIDDITKSDNLIAFANAFQDLISKNYPVFLIMTGLYENVYSLQTDKRCSFLLRAERITLEPLNKIGMKNQYQQTFQIDDAQALRMASETKGYSYAFQVLGYIMWDRECGIEDALPVFDERMADYCYESIWNGCSAKEREIISVIARQGKTKTGELIRSICGASNSFAVQRDRLIKKGILDGSEHGYLSLALPRFDVYVNAVYG